MSRKRGIPPFIIVAAREKRGNTKYQQYFDKSIESEKQFGCEKDRKQLHEAYKTALGNVITIVKEESEE